MDAASKPKVVPRFKPVSRETRFLRLRSIKCFELVHQKVLEGYPMAEIARFIQDERKEYADITRGSLMALLNDYRNSIPKAELISKRMPRMFEKAQKVVEKGLDELKELEKLYEKQMERIDIDITTEKKISKLMPSMTQEVRAAREILESYAQIKMDLGINTRHIGRLEVDGQISADMTARYGSEAVGRVLDSPESRRKVLGLVQRLLSVGSGVGEVLDVEAKDVSEAVPAEESGEVSAQVQEAEQVVVPPVVEEGKVEEKVSDDQNS